MSSSPPRHWPGGSWILSGGEWKGRKEQTIRAWVRIIGNYFELAIIGLATQVILVRLVLKTQRTLLIVQDSSGEEILRIVQGWTDCWLKLRSAFPDSPSRSQFIAIRFFFWGGQGAANTSKEKLANLKEIVKELVLAKHPTRLPSDAGGGGGGAGYWFPCFKRSGAGACSITIFEAGFKGSAHNPFRQQVELQLSALPAYLPEIFYVR